MSIVDFGDSQQIIITITANPNIFNDFSVSNVLEGVFKFGDEINTVYTSKNSDTVGTLAC